MKKGLLLIVLMVFGWVGVASALSYQFEDMIEENVWITDYASVTYTHNINDDVDFANGDFVTSANLELDFTNDNDDSSGRYYFFGWHRYDNREFASYGFDGSGFTLIGEVDNGQYDLIVNIDWLNDDGFLDVTLDLHNRLGTAWGTLDHSRLYGTAETAPVPEPGTLLLLGSGLAGLALYRRKRMK